jgi:hypothetical protein
LTTFEQVTTTGRETPTAYLNGRCEAEGVQGCRFWLMLADNGKPGEETHDIVGFLLFDGTGKRVGYGTGPVLPESGDVNVAPTPF